MNPSRIPDFANKSCEGMSIWFSGTSLRGLLFHYEDAPSEIVTTATNERTFTSVECAKLDRVMAEMFALFGDGVCEAAYSALTKYVGLRQAAL